MIRICYISAHEVDILLWRNDGTQLPLLEDHIGSVLRPHTTSCGWALGVRRLNRVLLTHTFKDVFFTPGDLAGS